MEIKNRSQARITMEGRAYCIEHGAHKDHTECYRCPLFIMRMIHEDTAPCTVTIGNALAWYWERGEEGRA